MDVQEEIPFDSNATALNWSRHWYRHPLPDNENGTDKFLR